MSKILYENHLEKTGEIVEYSEWILTEKRYKGQLRKFESYWDVLKRYGFVGLASYIVGGSAISSTGGLLAVPISFVLYAAFRKYSDDCEDECKGNTLCFNKCYKRACGPVIKTIAKEISAIKSSTKIDAKTKRKVLVKLNKELVKWVKRYNKYDKAIKKIQLDDRNEEAEMKANSIRQRALFYGGDI